jgi:hypothetical protein
VAAQLTRNQLFAIVNEVDATSTLFRHGFSILKEYRFASRDAEAVFVCMAGGAEKLLKLTVGMFAVDDGHGWPAQAAMRDAGHKITELDASARKMIDERVDRSTVPGVIRELLELTAANPGVWQIMATLERYATNGRFYNLDLLGGREQEDKSPQELWEELHMMVLDANPELLEQLAGAENDEARRTINGILMSTLGQWCELIYRSWVTGVCGPIAQEHSAALDLGHPEPRLKILNPDS